MTEQELYTLLSTDAGIAAITSRVVNGDLPEGSTLPAVTFEYTGDEAINTLAGDTGSRFSRFEVNAWAKSYSQARALMNAIELALISNYRESTDADHEEEIELYHFVAEYRFLT